MADVIDLASERIDAEMKARLRVLPTFNMPSLVECSECGDDMPQKRRAIGNIKRCIDCQDNHEKLVRFWNHGR